MEYIYPHTWYNVNQHTNLIGFDLNDGRIIGRRIPPGFYETVPDILKAIAIKDMEQKILFSFNPITKRVTINVRDNAKVILEAGLSEMLGYEPCEIASLDNNIEQTVDSSYVADP